MKQKGDTGVITQWKKDSAEFRNKLNISPSFSPWTGRAAFIGLGIKHNIRNLDMIDIIACKKTVGQKRTDANMKSALQNVFVDLSQGLKRWPCTSDDGTTHCLTTSSELYSYARDSAVLPLELLFLHGHDPKKIRMPTGMKHSDIQALAGEGIALPCLAVMLWSLYLLKGFP